MAVSYVGVGLSNFTDGDPPNSLTLPAEVSMAGRLAQAYSNADLTSYVTASITPPANRWLVIDVQNTATLSGAVEPTVAGLGLTWTQEATVANTDISARVTRFYAWTGTSPSSGAITIDFGVVTQSGCAHIVYHLFSGVDTADPFVQSVGLFGSASDTSIEVELAAFASSNNRPLITKRHPANQASTQEAGYAEIGDVIGSNPSIGFATAINPGTADTTPSYSWATAQNNRLAIASEVNVATPIPETTEVCVFYSVENTDGTVSINTTDGNPWTQRVNDRSSSGIFAIWTREYANGDLPPTFTHTGIVTGAAGDTTGAYIFALRGTDTANLIGEIVNPATVPGGVGVLGPVPGLIANLPVGDMVLVLGGRRDQWVSVNTLTGDGLTWNEILEWTYAGGLNGASVADYSINDTTAAVDVTDKTFTLVTPAPAAGSRGLMIWVKGAVEGGEEHSGSATVAGGGTITASGQEGAIQLATVGGGGTLLTEALKATSSSAIVSGNGTVIASGQEGGQELAHVNGGGTILTTGSVQKVTSSLTAGNGTIVGSGTKTTSVQTVVQGGGTVLAEGSAIQASEGSAVVNGGGTVTASGQEGGISPQTLVSGGGSITCMVSKSISSVAVVGGDGVVTSFGDKQSSIAIIVSGTGLITSDGDKGFLTIALVLGGGSILSSGVQGGKPPLTLSPTQVTIVNPFTIAEVVNPHNYADITD